MGCCGVGKCCFSIAGGFLQHSLGWRLGLGYDEVTITILGCSLLGEQQFPERALRAGHDLGGRAVFHDPAVFQDRDIVGQCRDVGRVVGDDDAGAPDLGEGRLDRHP